jgi:hypothetical protein
VATFKPPICTQINGLKSSISLASSMVKVQPNDNITSLISNGWDLSLSKSQDLEGMDVKHMKILGNEKCYFGV